MSSSRRVAYKQGMVVYKPRLEKRPSKSVRVTVATPSRNRAPRIKGAIPHMRELKYVDIAAATYVSDTTGSVTLLNGIAVGDDNTTRNGRQVTIKSVQVRGKFVPVDGSTVASKARLMLVWDNAAAGATAAIAAILTAATSSSFPLVNNANRFTILVDRTFTIGQFDTTATQAIAGSPTVHDIEIYKRVNAVTQYNGTGATDASIQNGALLMVTIADNAAAAGGTFTLATRVRFVDD